MVAALAYDLVYDAARLPFPGWPIALLGVAVAVGGAGIGTSLRRRGNVSSLTRVIVTSAIVFGTAWALFVGGGLYAQHARLRDALREGRYTRVEGIVYDRPTSGAADQTRPSWVVESGDVAHWYRYDRSPLSVGYRRSGPGAGGITNGARVRIADVGGRIARLEVER